MKILNNRFQRILIPLGSLLTLALIYTPNAFAVVDPHRRGGSSTPVSGKGDILSFLSSGYGLAIAVGGSIIGIGMVIHAVKSFLKSDVKGMLVSCVVAFLAVLMISGAMYKIMKGSAEKVEQGAGLGGTPSTQTIPRIR